ncbi:hypothetical protein CK203_114891 [Vitis vinifera]|uniref:Retrovirus-related Pol polyprotein from transposon RE1 n=1 Tax=Vitis vinifera TaxID=29760 RepID=A0A438D901_VITVI|nr:hypothetical protein CK203_114891 [Vitis vinifera]
MDQPSIENHKVQDDKGLLEPFKASTSPGKRREMNSLGPNGKDANFVWDPGGIQHNPIIPDIAYYVNRLARYTNNPAKEHWFALIRVLRYLKHPVEYGLQYTRYPSVIEGFSDAN